MKHLFIILFSFCLIMGVNSAMSVPVEKGNKKEICIEKSEKVSEVFVAKSVVTFDCIKLDLCQLENKDGLKIFRKDIKISYRYISEYDCPVSLEKENNENPPLPYWLTYLGSAWFNRPCLVYNNNCRYKPIITG